MAASQPLPCAECARRFPELSAWLEGGTAMNKVAQLPVVRHESQVTGYYPVQATRDALPAAAVLVTCHLPLVTTGHVPL